MRRACLMASTFFFILYCAFSHPFPRWTIRQLRESLCGWRWRKQSQAKRDMALFSMKRLLERQTDPPSTNVAAALWQHLEPDENQKPGQSWQVLMLHRYDAPDQWFPNLFTSRTPKLTQMTPHLMRFCPRVLLQKMYENYDQKSHTFCFIVLLMDGIGKNKLFQCFAVNPLWVPGGENKEDFSALYIWYMPWQSPQWV